jgi:hypothetical protein
MILTYYQHLKNIHYLKVVQFEILKFSKYVSKVFYHM